MVEVIPFDRAAPGEFGDLPVEGVEVSRQDDEEGADYEELRTLPAEVEGDAAQQRHDQTYPRYGVGVHVDEFLRNGRQESVGLFTVFV